MSMGKPLVTVAGVKRQMISSMGRSLLAPPSPLPAGRGLAPAGGGALHAPQELWTDRRNGWSSRLALVQGDHSIQQYGEGHIAIEAKSVALHIERLVLV